MRHSTYCAGKQRCSSKLNRSPNGNISCAHEYDSELRSDVQRKYMRQSRKRSGYKPSERFLQLGKYEHGYA